MRYYGRLQSLAKCLTLIYVLLIAPLSADEPPTVCREAAFGVRETRFPQNNLGFLNVGAEDFNKDGYGDFWVAGPGRIGGLSIYRGGPDGVTSSVFPFDSELRQYRGHGWGAAGDFNGDGFTDFAVRANGGCLVGLNDRGTIFRGVPPSNCGSSDSLAAIDFDGDGHLDLLTWIDQSGAVSALRGHGDGTFTSGNQRIRLPVLRGIVVAPGDFNGDGLVDLAMAGHFASSEYPDARDRRVYVGLGDGTGAFHPVDIEKGLAVGEAPYRLASDDINRDGRLDLVVTDSRAVRVFLGNGDGRFSLSSEGEILLPLSPGAVHLDDYNADGDIDIAVTTIVTSLTSVTGRGRAILLGDGLGGFQLDDVRVSDFEPGVYGGFTATGDVTGDGRPDLTRVEIFQQTGQPRELVITDFINSCPVRVTKEATEPPCGRNRQRLDLDDHSRSRYGRCADIHLIRLVQRIIAPDNERLGFLESVLLDGRRGGHGTTDTRYLSGNPGDCRSSGLDQRE